MKTNLRWCAALCAGLVTVVGCRSMYYSTMEVFGKQKRDLLKSNVQAARDDQKAATEQFKDALTRLKESYGFDGGQLETVYNRMNRDYELCTERANTVRGRIRKVETIAEDLFKEWDGEIKTMSSDSLKALSRRKLLETRVKYDSLHASMRKAEQSMEPVLVQFHDQVLFLKHNLNAQAVGSLQGETASIEKEISRLIADMNASIAEADSFLKGME